MAFGDEAHLARRWTQRIDHKKHLDIWIAGKSLHQHAACLVVATDTDQGTTGAKARNVARDVSGPAHHGLAAFDGNHRRRRLRRNSLDRPIVELVEHEIADAQNRLPLELKEVVVEHAG